MPVSTSGGGDVNNNPVQSRLIINLVLLFLVVSLGLFLINSNDEPIETETALLTSIDKDSINHITINNLNDKEISFAKKEGQWRMQTPYQAPAHPTRINALLNILESESVHQLDTDKIELNRFQLDPANQTLRLNEHEFLFGDINPLDKTRYVLFQDKIHLINDNLYQQLSTNPTFFINPKILPDKSFIKSIETPDYVLKNEESGWTMEKNKDMDEKKITDIKETWGELEANTIQELTFNEASNHININLNDGRVIEYMIMPESKSLILGRKDLNLQFHISEYLANLIFPVNVEVTTPEK